MRHVALKCVISQFKCPPEASSGSTSLNISDSCRTLIAGVADHITGRRIILPKPVTYQTTIARGFVSCDVPALSFGCNYQ